MSGGGLAFWSLAIAGTAGFRWYRALAEVRVPRVLIGYQVAFALAFALAVAAIGNAPGFLWGIVAFAVTLASTAYLVLSFTGYQQRNAPTVQVGSPILDFTALDSDGKPYQLSSLHGRPFLLKFFRGHW